MMAPKGHWYTQLPQERQRSLSMVAEKSSAMPMVCCTLQAFWQGRRRLAMAL